MKEKTFKVLLTLIFALVLCMASITVVAADDGVNTEAEFVTAIAADGEITLTGDIDLTSVVTVTGNVTLKADSAVKITSTVVDVFTVTGTLTLGENITVETTNSILYAKGGTINIEGATLISTHEKNALGFADNGGIINMNSGSVKSGKNTSLTASGAGSQVNINGGIVEATSGNATLAKNAGTTTIKDGIVKSGEIYVTLWVKENGNLVVEGGTITPTEGYAISVESGNGTISAGVINGPMKAKEGATLAVSGGTYKANPFDYVAEGYVITYADNLYTVADLAEAIAAGGEITLTGDINLTSVVAVEGNVILKADSPVKITSAVVDVFTVTGTLTLGENITVETTNSILYAKGGTINIEGATLISTHEKNALGFVDNGGIINMNSGSVKSGKNTSLTASGVGSQVNINGGTVEATSGNATLAKNAGTTTIKDGIVKSGEIYVTLWVKENGNLVVEGGTITPTEGYAISVESGNGTISAGVINGPMKAKEGATLSVSGGTYTADPSTYAAEGYVVTYAEEVYVVALPEEKPESDAALEDLVEVKEDEVKAEFKTVFGEEIDDEDIEIEVRSSLDVTVEDDALDTEENTYTVDIKAIYEVVAVSDNKELTVVEDYLDTVGKAVTVTVELPAEFTNNGYVYVKHYKEGDHVGTYPVTVDGTTASFINKDGFSTFEFYSTDEIDYSVIDVTHNLNLSSEIAFSFFISFEDLPSKEGLTATITHGDKVVNNVVWNEYDDNKDQVNDYWRLIYNGVAAKEMGDLITLTITDGDGTELIKDVSSVKEYATLCIDNDYEEADLMRALLNYGAEAQKYFNYNTNELVNEGYEYAVAPSVNTETVTGGDVVTHNLSLASKIDLSFFINKDALSDVAGFKAVITKGTEAPREIVAEDWETYSDAEGDFYRIRYTWVAPKEIDVDLVLSIKNSNNEEVVSDTFSVSDYADLCINNDYSEKALMTALKYYGAEAKEYFSNN